ncbi:beta-glucosidase [Malassezia pachydermatis]|uniref:glucan 1,3-beta-glucosidase n=1 Tax=Malassezia pachydermatis TaxID=77020 RepID=A0A0M9VNX5_9BASI|nr:glucan -beta-glucosidase precursor [Malassezia pachydermatis]KOS13823.1 glucan -beta-glucosidase precursor [Malassezia pachydermatis]
MASTNPFRQGGQTAPAPPSESAHEDSRPSSFATASTAHASTVSYKVGEVAGRPGVAPPRWAYGHSIAGRQRQGPYLDAYRSESPNPSSNGHTVENSDAESFASARFFDAATPQGSEYHDADLAPPTTTTIPMSSLGTTQEEVFKDGTTQPTIHTVKSPATQPTIHTTAPVAGSAATVQTAPPPPAGTTTIRAARPTASSSSSSIPRSAAAGGAAGATAAAGAATAPSHPSAEPVFVSQSSIPPAGSQPVTAPGMAPPVASDDLESGPVPIMSHVMNMQDDPSSVPPPAPRQPSFLQRWWRWILAVIAIIVILAIALGVGLGVGLNNGSSDKNNLASPGAKSNSPGAQSSSMAAQDSKAASEAKNLKPLPRWDWTSKTQKVFGTNLGGLFMLERWLYEDWMVQAGGYDAWDEYHMSLNLGDKMVDQLNYILDTWFTEADMDTIQSAGINMIRIPIGYWPFLSTELTKEPYRNATHLDKLSDVMYWSWKRNMYVLIDMHGMPGSQNNDQSSGYNNTQLDSQQISMWYTPENQNFSRQAVTNMLDWVDRHPAKSVIAGVTTVNEPKVYTNDTYMSLLKDYYDWSLQTLRKYKLPLIAHHAFLNNPYDYWQSYASNQDPSEFILDDHPYPAWYQTPEPEDQTVMTNNICKFAQSTSQFPVPVLMGEYSAVSNVNTTDWTTQYLNTEVKVFGWSAGSMFFNFRVNASANPVVGPSQIIGKKYSMLDMMKQNSPIGTFPRRDNSTSVVNWTNSLSSACGDNPGMQW